MPNEIKLLLREFSDDKNLTKNFEKTQEFIDRVNEYVTKQSQLLDFEHQEIVIDSAVTNKKIPHSRGVVPLDIIQTSLVGAGTLTWNYANFTKDTLDVSTTGACTVRAYIGTHKAGSSI